MPRILQITDTHLVAAPGLLGGVLDPRTALERTVADIAASLPKLEPVDALVVTGDLSDDGSAQSYALLREGLEPLGLPVLPVPGNHDARENMRSAFADLDLFASSGRLNWVRDIGGLHVVGIDTMVDNSGSGTIDEETARFLDAALAWDGPVLLAMHHPPFISGISFMDAIGLPNAERLAGALQRSPAEIRIVCGHVHMMAAGSVGGRIAIACPSVCSSFDVDFRPDAPVGFFPGGGGFMIHDWAGEFRSTLIPSVHYGTPTPF